MPNPLDQPNRLHRHPSYSDYERFNCSNFILY